MNRILVCLALLFVASPGFAQVLYSTLQCKQLSVGPGDSQGQLELKKIGGGRNGQLQVSVTGTAEAALSKFNLDTPKDDKAVLTLTCPGTSNTLVGAINITLWVGASFDGPHCIAFYRCVGSNFRWQDPVPISGPAMDDDSGEQ